MLSTPIRLPPGTTHGKPAFLGSHLGQRPLSGALVPHLPHDGTLPGTRASHILEAASSRRDLLLATSGLLASLVAAPGSSRADELPDLLLRVLPNQPQPVFFPRKALNTNFAVLLMRSSYESTDALDFIAMNDFQRLFWRLRASEQEAYNLQYDPLKPRVGDLSDPLYFDFISTMQYLTISRSILDSPQVFKEYCGEECPPGTPEGEQYRVVRRPAQYADNKLLPAAFERGVGERIYTGLRDGFRGEQFGAPGPLPQGASDADILEATRKLMGILVDNGFAFKAVVTPTTDDDDGPSSSSSPSLPLSPSQQPQAQSSARRQKPLSFTIELQGPANLWGLSTLLFRRANVTNDYSGMLLSAYYRQGGLTARVYTTTTDSSIQQTWEVL